MKQSLRFIVFFAYAFILLVKGTSAMADTSDSFTPQFEVAGPWIIPGSPLDQATVTRNGKRVVWIYNNGGYNHVFKGEYVDDVTIKGIQTRWNRSNHTMTRMALTMTFLSPDLIKQVWVALDSNSDLTKGETGEGLVCRPPALNNSAHGID